MSDKPSQPPAKLQGGFAEMELFVPDMLQGARGLFESAAMRGANC